MGRLIYFHSVILVIAITVFGLVSKAIFDNVYVTSKNVIDEAFHLPQGLAYCNKNFSTWDPKITTLPGLYLITAAVLGPFNLCSVYWLRFVNLLVSIFNVILFYILFTIQEYKGPWKKLLSSINLALLPPLYFFSFVYYTDVMALCFILLALIFSEKDKHVIASIFGMVSVIIRQTNIIWVVMFFIKYMIEHIVPNIVRKKLKKESDYPVTFSHLKKVTNRKMWDLLKYLTAKEWLNIFTYCAVMISFLFFILINGSIVVGDKSAHTPSFHIPQLFYFITFCLVFAWPHFLSSLFTFFPFVRQKRNLSVLILILFGFVVAFNTEVHPYLLADNRHYTFYIWNRFYGKYIFFRFIMILPYYFGFYCLMSRFLLKTDISFTLAYVPCAVLLLIMQKLIEIRYFLIPYVMVRLNLKGVSHRKLLLEFIFLCSINCFTLNVFFNKDLMWSDFKDVQRIIW